jgi:hypothetical protein
MGIITQHPMKNLWIALLNLSAAAGSVSGQSLTDDSVYHVVELGPHHKIWQRTESETGPADQRVMRWVVVKPAFAPLWPTTDPL